MSQSPLQAAGMGRSISPMTGKPAGFAFGAGSRAGRTNKRSAPVMLVRHILQDQGGTTIAIAHGATMGEAARLLAEKRIGAVIVPRGADKLAGILSERDVVRAVAADGPVALDRMVSVYMTK